jgi:hypothetical protein
MNVMPPAALPARARRRIATLMEVDDVELGARLLRGTPTNESRDHEELARISRAVQEFGEEIAGADHTARVDGTLDVRERHDGLEADAPVLARYLPRRRRIDLYVDVIGYCEDVVRMLAWQDLFPPGYLREAVLLHEHAHELLAHRHATALRRATGVVALRIGRYTRYAHVAGAEELAAHAYARAALGLARSPLLVTTAAMAAIDESTSPSPAATVSKES